MLLAVSIMLAVAACGETRSAPPASGPAPEVLLPDVAVVACTANGTKLLTPAVQPQPDGIHIELRQESGDPATLSTDTGGGGKPGERIVLTGAPDATHMGCMTDADWNADPPAHRGWVTLQVHDQRGLWVDDRPAPAQCSSAIYDYDTSAPGTPESDLAELVARHFKVGPGETVERAGYPEQRPIEYRLVRDGVVVGVAQFTPSTTSGWLIESVTDCRDA